MNIGIIITSLGFFFFLFFFLILYFLTLQIKASVSALRNTSGLNWPTSADEDPHRQTSGQLDLLDWLRATFGFQACNDTSVIANFHYLIYLLTYV